VTNFSNIIINIILPIFIQIGAGFLIQKKFQLNTSTMAKLQLYIFLPALLFTSFYETNVTAQLFLYIVLIMIILFIVLLIVSQGLSKILRFPKRTTSTYVNSVIFFNSGNFCIPVLTLMFIDNEILKIAALSVQIVILLTQNVLLNTFGIFYVNAGQKTILRSLVDTFKIPMIYAVIIAVILRLLNIGVYEPIWNALDTIKQGIVPLALITLGAQLANTKMNFKLPKIYLSNFFRLIISPFIAFILVKLFSIDHIDPLAAQVIIICSAAPTAVNTVLLAIEYDNEPELSSQIVFSSTLFSAITVSIIIGIVGILFPI